jgi:hypothetical protein
MPLYIDNTKPPLLFLHIPKTGGTTIEAWLESVYENTPQFLHKVPVKNTQISPQHYGYKHLTGLLDGQYKEPLFKFTVVRNPYTRLESEFFYRAQMRAINLGPHPESMFSAWVCDVIQRANACPHIYDNHLRSQIYYYNVDVSVYKFEEGIEGIIRKIALKLDLAPPKTLDSKKVGKKKPVVWSNKALCLVNQFYQDDFSQFKYRVIKGQKQTFLESVSFAYYRLCYSILTRARQLKHKLQKSV